MRAIQFWACVLLLTVPWGAAFSGDDLPTVDEVRQHLREWRQDFVAFRIRYENSQPPFATRFWDFLMTDTHNYVDIEEIYRPNKDATKQAKGGNGKFRFQAGYTSADQGKTWKLTSLREDVRTSSNVGVAKIVTPLYLLLDQYHGRWMDEYYFSDNDVRITGRETIEGESCIVLDVTYKRQGMASGNGSKVWLAENKDYLIKKVSPNPGPPTGYRDADYLCLEYRKVEKHWYPYSGQLLLPPDQSFWKTVVFEVNPVIHSQTFQAPSHAGLVNPVSRPVERSTEQAGEMQRIKPARPLPPARPDDRMVPILVAILLFVGGAGLIGWWKLRTSN